MIGTFHYDTEECSQTELASMAKLHANSDSNSFHKNLKDSKNSMKM